MSALRTKMIYWRLHHVLLFSTMTQNHSCSAHNSDMQTSSVPSTCSVARNTEHIMFSTLRAMIGEYSAGWAEKKGRKLSSVACIYIVFFCNYINVARWLHTLNCKCCLIYQTYPEHKRILLSPCCCILLFPFGFFPEYYLKVL